MPANTPTEFNWSIEVAPASTPSIAIERIDDPGRADPPAAEPVQRLRRWESAETTRLNQHQWGDIQTNPINVDLATDLPTLVARCRYERYNNPLVEGVVETYATDVVGEQGPQLVVESDSEQFNQAYRHYWREWFSTLCVDGMSGVDLLYRLVGQDFTDGDWLHQLINLSDRLPSSQPVKTRLLDIDPQRLQDPLTFGPDIVGPIRRDTFGIPIEYYIRDPKKQAMPRWRDISIAPLPIPAEDIIHVFHSREPGQVRGFPRLASCLQEMADLRDYDHQVLDTARVQANNGMLLFTRDPAYVGENPVPFQGKIALERQVAKAVPPGYEVAGQQSTQPAAYYVDFRHEKLRSLGRVVNMPLLMILLSAEDSNFSQSRIDINVIYQRGINRYQQWIEANWLKRLLEVFNREIMLATVPGSTRTSARFLLPPKPPQIQIRWGWEPMPQANPTDFVKTQAMKIQLGLSAPALELADAGIDEDLVLDSLATTNRKRTARGLPPLVVPPEINGNLNANAQAQQNQTQNDGPKKSAKNAAKRRANARLLADA